MPGITVGALLRQLLSDAVAPDAGAEVGKTMGFLRRTVGDGIRAECQKAGVLRDPVDDSGVAADGSCIEVEGYASEKEGVE